MREIHYNSNFTPKVDNEVKLLALYYDKIHVANDAVWTPTFKLANGKFEFDKSIASEFISKTFRNDYKLLIEEGIIEIAKHTGNHSKEFEQRFSTKVNDLISSHQVLIFPNQPTDTEARIITEEVYDIMKNMVDYEWGKPVEVNFIGFYYASKIKWTIKTLIEGNNCISSSNNLNTLFSSLIKELKLSKTTLEENGYNKALAFDAIKYSLPNPDSLSLEDILELKFKLKDELLAFSQVINSIEVRNKQVFSEDIKGNGYQAVLFNEVQKPLLDLETKMKNLKSKTFRHFIDRIQNPKSYVPLIGTIAASLPMEYALLASLGLTAGQSFLEFKEEKREISNNGLSFLLKIK
jgi:hypothetical protein